MRRDSLIRLVVIFIVGAALYTWAMPTPHRPHRPYHPPRDITEAEFHSIVMDPDRDVFVKFYAPWCRACKQFEPDWQAFARQLHTHHVDATVVSVDADKYGSFVQSEDLSQFPTVKLYRKASKKGITFKSKWPYKVDGLLTFAEMHDLGTF